MTKQPVKIAVWEEVGDAVSGAAWGAVRDAVEEEVLP